LHVTSLTRGEDPATRLREQCVSKRSFKLTHALPQSINHVFELKYAPDALQAEPFGAQPRDFSESRNVVE
jgi:hypothetical protein